MGPLTLGWKRFLVVRQSAKFEPKLGGFEALAPFAVLPLGGVNGAVTFAAGIGAEFAE
jgi:hypothetical protein